MYSVRVCVCFMRGKLEGFTSNLSITTASGREYKERGKEDETGENKRDFNLISTAPV